MASSHSPAAVVAQNQPSSMEEVTMKDINDFAKLHLKRDGVYQEIVNEKAPPELSAEEIDQLVAEMDKAVEKEYEIDYSLFSLYMYENQPICPYCTSVLTFFDGSLYCESKGCLNMHFAVPVHNIADIAWQMKNIHDAHVDSGCKQRMEFILSATSPDFVFADCDKCKYLNYIQLR